MRRWMSVIRAVCFVGTWMMGTGAGPAWANPTGAGLLSYPVEPCRVLDTRVSLGPLAPRTAMDVYVRGSALQASDGAAQADCGIPPEAEAVVLNVTAISPTGGGNLKVNGTGWVGGVNGVYSRINYRLGENDANEIQVSLCNVFLYPAAQVPCPANEGRYADLQILNTSSFASLHVVADVVGYLARPPRGIEGIVTGVVVEKNLGLPKGEEDASAYDLLLDTSVHVVCMLPYSSVDECDVPIGTRVQVSGHVENFSGRQYLYAHGDVGVAVGR